LAAVLKRRKMMRDYRKLKAFQLADELAVAVYEATRSFPRSEQFGLTAQLRKCAVSAPSNIVEGCSRHTRADYLRFLDIAYGSEHECRYQLSLAHRLGYLAAETYRALAPCCPSA
jgi:four helix bundle protein